jgi:diacylglycerol O-acyltransferase
MERLTAQDLSMLWPDDVGWPQDIGALVILEGRSLLGPDGRVRIDDVRHAIEARLHLIPRFRQRLYMPRLGLGWPLWVDAPDFDIADQVNVRPVPAPGDEAQLLRVLEQLRRRPWDRSRPLWQMWLLPGVSDGRVGLYIRVHHAIADGVAGVATLGAILDAHPRPPVTRVPPWKPAPLPSTRALLRDNLQRRRTELARVLSTLAHPVTTARRVRTAWPAVHETLAAERAPRTSINRPIGSGRRFVVVRSRLDLVRQVARTHDAKINDVLAAAVAGGLRDLLHSRGERVDHVVLRAYVPVSLHREQPGQARGNRDGMMAIPLPIGVPDPSSRLRLIAAETAKRRRRARPAAGTLLRGGLIQRAFLRVMAHQRWANAYIANVPGPPVPLYFAGVQVVEVFPVVPLIGNITIGVGALSYADQFNITTVADRDECPDVEVFVQGIRDSLDGLRQAARLREATGEDPGDWGGSDRHRLRRTCPRPGMRCRCWRTAHAPRRSPETASPPATCSTDRRQRRRCGLLVTSPTRTT